MEFGAPVFLWGLPLSGLPVVFHLLMKRRRKRVRFSSLLFLLEADPRLHSRRRLREILLLIARVLIILLLVLALSKPSLNVIPGLGQNVEIIIAVDNSGSMDAPARGKGRKLEVAKAGAGRLIDGMGENTRAAVLPLVREPGAEVPELVGEPDVLKDRVETVRRTEATVRMGEFVDRVRRVTRGMEGSAGKAVHVFTDLHETTWADEDGGLGRLPDDVDVVFHRIPSQPRPEPNVALRSLLLPDRTLLPGHTFRVGAVVENLGTTGVDVRVNYADSVGGDDGRMVSVSGEESQIVRFPFKPDEPGDHWATIAVEGDSFRADNRGAAALVCRPEGRVVLAGEREVYGIIPRAISPTGTGQYTSLVPEYRSLSEIPLGDGGDPPLMLVLTWNHLSGLASDNAEKLHHYVRNGGTVLVVPAANGEEQVNIGGLPEWLPLSVGSPESPEDPVVARVLNSQHREWSRLWGQEGSVPIDFFLVHRYRPLELPDTFTGLAGPTGRRPFFAVTEIEQGRVYVSGMALDRRWTPLVTDPSGLVVVMLHRMATGGGGPTDAAGSLQVAAGDEVPLPLRGAEESVTVNSLIGDTINVTLDPGEKPVFPRVGAYRIGRDDRTYHVSVRGARKEGSTRYVTGDTVPAAGERRHEVVEFAPDLDLADQLRHHFGGLSLFMPLAVLILLIWGAESWLATTHRKRSRSLARGAD